MKFYFSPFSFRHPVFCFRSLLTCGAAPLSLSLLSLLFTGACGTNSEVAGTSTETKQDASANSDDADYSQASQDANPVRDRNVSEVSSSSDVLADGGTDEKEGGVASLCREGETRCGDDTYVARCNGNNEWVKSPCGADQSCGEGNSQSRCITPTQAQKDDADDIDDMIDRIVANTGYPYSLDVSAIKSSSHQILFGGGQDSFYRASYHAFSSIPMGHQSWVVEDAVEDAGTTIPEDGYSLWGVCAMPYKDDALVVTGSNEKNALGLNAGDRIVGEGSLRGKAFLDDVARRPRTTSEPRYGQPSSAGNMARSALTYFGTIREGAVLHVIKADAKEAKEVKVPAKGQIPLTCDGFYGPILPRDLTPAKGGPALPKVEDAFVIDKDTARIHIRAFGPKDYDFFPGYCEADCENKEYQSYRTSLVELFNKVKTSKSLIWDLRGNGRTYGVSYSSNVKQKLFQLVLEIVAGFPGAKQGKLASCAERQPGSSPATFGSGQDYVIPNPNESMFKYSGKVAVLIDGATSELGDYFAYAAKTATSAILVGTPTSGAFGGSTSTRQMSKSKKISFAYDSRKCVDIKGVPLEGKSVVPHVMVEYEFDFTGNKTLDAHGQAAINALKATAQKN